VGTSEKNSGPAFGVVAWLGLAAVLGGVFWSYWPTFVTMAGKWEADPQYSHGWLVPAFAAALLWLRWDKLELDKVGVNWLGLLLVLLGTGMRLGAGWLNLDWFDGLSLVPTLIGLCMLFGGTAALKWAWPALGFLIFMVPLPYSVERMMMGPLRNLGTVTSTYVMQTLGLPAIDEGNIIHLGEHTIGVAEACSGLRMLVIFFALSTAVALVIDRSLWVKLLIVVSAIPIALISNITRITVTGLAYEWLNPELAESIFHDWAGWLMMPLGLALLWLELWLLSHLFVEEEDDSLETLGMGIPGNLAKKSASESSPDKPSSGNKVQLPFT